MSACLPTAAVRAEHRRQRDDFRRQNVAPHRRQKVRRRQPRKYLPVRWTSPRS